MSISVIVPVFNTSRYLDECIASLVNQGLDDIEIICVDDGSTDDSANKLRRWAERDQRIKFISQKNAGQGAARNRAIGLATKSYLMFVDSDDVLLPGAMRHLLDLVGKSHVLSFRHVTFSDNSAVPDPFFSRDVKRDRTYMARQMGVVWNKIVSRSWWLENRVRFKEGVIFEDIPVHWKLVLVPRDAAYTDSVLYALRVRAGSTTAENSASLRRVESVLAHEEVSVFLDEIDAKTDIREVHRVIALRNLAGCMDALRHISGTQKAHAAEIFHRILRGYSRGGPVNLAGLGVRETVTIKAYIGSRSAKLAYSLFLLMRNTWRNLTLKRS